MAECRGEDCTVIKYKFKWENIRITAAEGIFASGSPARENTHAIDADKATAQTAKIKKGIDKKAKDQADEESKHGRSLTKKIVKGTGEELILVDATCGPDGKCLCDDLGEDVKTLPDIRKSITISGLTAEADAFNTTGEVCKGYSVTFTTHVTPETSKGRCLSLGPESF